MTVVGRVRRGYAVLAILILLTAGLYVARYLVVDRPNGADRVTEQALTGVGQAVPTRRPSPWSRTPRWTRPGSSRRARSTA